MNPSRKNTNVVTSDGGGDSTYESVYLVKNGQFKRFIVAEQAWLEKCIAQLHCY